MLNHPYELHHLPTTHTNHRIFGGGCPKIILATNLGNIWVYFQTQSPYTFQILKFP
jgi:hypothetical protein